MMKHMLSGVFTIQDDEMYRLLAFLEKCENIRLEPSALAGFSGVSKILRAWEKLEISADKKHAAHFVWATGGKMVPDDVWEEYYAQGCLQ